MRDMETKLGAGQVRARRSRGTIVKHLERPAMKRRRLLGGFAAASIALASGRSWVQAASASSSCVLTPAQTEGPFFVDERLQRVDLRVDPRACIPIRATRRGRSSCGGFQRTDGTGMVHFETIYPGAYPGRAVHVHFKVRRQDGRELTSQLYFDDALTDRVQAHVPYTNARRTRNGDDYIYRRGGRDLTLDVVARGDGFAANYDTGVRI
jgi:hypothetical protein